jgi:hypothetical protein
MDSSDDRKCWHRVLVRPWTLGRYQSLGFAKTWSGTANTRARKVVPPAIHSDPWLKKVYTPHTSLIQQVLLDGLAHSDGFYDPFCSAKPPVGCLVEQRELGIRRPSRLPMAYRVAYSFLYLSVVPSRRRTGYNNLLLIMPGIARHLFTTLIQRGKLATPPPEISPSTRIRREISGGWKLSVRSHPRTKVHATGSGDARRIGDLEGRLGFLMMQEDRGKATGIPHRMWINFRSQSM